MRAKKIATSLPAGQFRALEQTRKRLRIRRSEAIQHALAAWLASRDEDDRIGRYITGYQARPEDAGTGSAFAEAWANGLEAEDW